MVGIKPPSPQQIWRFSSAYFYREVISQINNLWYNILEVIIKGWVVDHRERAESIVSWSGLHLKYNAIFFYVGGRRECIMSIFCSLIREECNTFHSQSTVKTLESASQLPYRHMSRQLSCFPSEWSIQEKWRWTSPWRIWIYLNLRGAKGPGNLCLARIEAERRQAA